MHWFQSLDTGLFHLINPALSNPLFDILMPFFSGNHFFGPALFIICALLICKGGARGRVFLLMLLLAIILTDPIVCNTLKHVIHRPRPFWTLPDVHVPAGVGRTDSGSMPSSHAANWFAGVMVALIYYRRSWRFMLPLALIVCFSRIYNGVHYPSDVLAGAIIGAGCGACLVWTLDGLWQWLGRNWFPLWFRRLPSLMNPVVVPKPENEILDPKFVDLHWIRFAYLLIFVQFIINVAYLASGAITLSEDEAYQWIWSKHLDISYYSKPLFIALAQWAGTHLWGDTAFGVRFFAPVITVVTALVLLPFMRRVTNARVAFWLTVLLPAVPLITVGSILMTIDPLSVMFWLLAMISGWAAVQENATWRNWFMVGLWMGMGFLSKYTSLFQLLSWILFFILWPPARKQLRTFGPYLALLVNVACSTPVLIWNAQRHWITIEHVSENAHLDKEWAFTPNNLWHGFTHYTLDFFVAETSLQNPFIFIPVLWVLFAFWRRSKRDPLMLYFFSMGAPVFVVYLLWTFHSRVLPNWIAPSIVPFVCLAVIYFELRWREGKRRYVKLLLVGAIIYGAILSLALRDTNIVFRAIGVNSLPDLASALRNHGWAKPAQFVDSLPLKINALDSTRRVKGWNETAQAIDDIRQKLIADEGKPVFLIGGHYGITGEITFHLPEAKAGVPDHPIVYYLAITNKPQNQFYFWPNYLDRKGQNAIFLHEMEIQETNVPGVPGILYREFESVTNTGSIVSFVNGKPMHRIQIAICRNLK